MSFTNETTHYGIPLPLGSDLTTPMDYNTSMQAVDTALFGAVGDAATATQDAADAKSTAQGAAGDVVTLTGRLGDDEATIASQGQAITGLQNGVADVRADLSDAICAIKEPTATATYAHAVGAYFWYNDTLYITTVAIEVGDTIVPNTNCETTNITAELLKIDIPDISTLQTRVGALETNVTGIDGQLKASNATAGVTDVPFRFGCNDAGQFGYIITEGGADTVIPFSSGVTFTHSIVTTGNSGQYFDGTTVHSFSSASPLTTGDITFTDYGASGWLMTPNTAVNAKVVSFDSTTNAGAFRDVTYAASTGTRLAAAGNIILF